MRLVKAWEVKEMACMVSYCAQWWVLPHSAIAYALITGCLCAYA